MLVFVTDYNVNINRQTQKSNIIQDKFIVAPPIEEKLMDTRLVLVLKGPKLML